ncbi:unnamed protein product [Paramecium octaurelia]|uniref:Uncharacterized protein n=1 Tax=Paramecium octaurelia TaxID=43137 RepID=A0A8S1SCJ4_PAROT|nr:unnamed protein product [Paramecium octaurelia]
MGCSIQKKNLTLSQQIIKLSSEITQIPQTSKDATERQQNLNTLKSLLHNPNFTISQVKCPNFRKRTMHPQKQ